MTRRILLLAAFLLVGALAQAIVAQACGASGDVGDAIRVGAPASPAEVRWLRSRVDRHGWLEALDPDQTQWKVREYGRFGVRQIEVSASVLTPDRLKTVAATEQRNGFPFRSMGWSQEYWMEAGAVAPADSDGGAVIRHWHRDASLPWSTRRITLVSQVFAVPFALNSVLYALVLWIATVGRTLARRRWRTHRGRCHACAHPLAGASRCPECGDRSRRSCERRGRPRDGFQGSVHR